MSCLIKETHHQPLTADSQITILSGGVVMFSYAADRLSFQQKRDLMEPDSSA